MRALPFAAALSFLLTSNMALANDLGDAVAWVEDAVGETPVSNYAAISEEHPDDAIGMIVARDVTLGASLDSYDCNDATIDKVVMRTSGEQRWAHRYCMQARWKRDSLPGYRTLGKVRLRQRDVQRWIDVASRETEVPAGMIETIILYSSGYRPGVVSESGHYGLMQLKPELLREVGLSFNNLLDPRENILVGARYLQRLIYRFSSIKLALAAYIKGPRHVEASGNTVPTDEETVWFMREMLILYFASIREVPKGIGSESMAFVLTWLD